MKHNRAKLGCGDVRALVEVVRDLSQLATTHGVGMRGRDQYKRAHEPLGAELMFAYDVDASRARTTLDRLVVDEVEVEVEVEVAVA